MCAEYVYMPIVRVGVGTDGMRVDADVWSGVWCLRIGVE